MSFIYNLSGATEVCLSILESAGHTPELFPTFWLTGSCEFGFENLVRRSIFVFQAYYEVGHLP